METSHLGAIGNTYVNHKNTSVMFLCSLIFLKIIMCEVGCFSLLLAQSLSQLNFFSVNTSELYLKKSMVRGIVRDFT